MKRCPICGLLVDERFRYCDCGYDWAIPEEKYRRTPAGRKQRIEIWRRIFRPPLNLLLAFVLLPAALALVLVLAGLIMVLLSGGLGHHTR